ncbi:MAG: HAMP domain-containing protein [Planctomycetes bacterium]|nr:HAMP domain-containing protein [Planctomycetota bacterium]
MPLKTRLLISFLLVVLLTGCIIAAVGVQVLRGVVSRQAQRRMGRDLESALEFYDSRLHGMRTAIACAAVPSGNVRRALAGRDLKTLGKALAELRDASGLDALGVTDATGRVVMSTGSLDEEGDDLSRDALIAKVLQEKRPLSATQAWSSGRLTKGGPSEAPATGSAVSGKGVLLMVSAAPVLTDTREFAGVLYGGRLLTDVLAPLHGNVEVSTETSSAEDIAAPDGRQMPACKPLRDSDGRIAAALCVVAPEDGYARTQRKAVLLFSGATAGCMVLALAFSFVLSGAILRPLRELTKGVSQLSSGNVDYRIKIGSRGPLSELAGTFNRMANSIKKHDEQIKKDAEKMMEAKRLATLGQLAAGVAHEINNPLGGITVYAHLLMEDLPPDDPRVEEVGKIIHQADRCKRIVKGLLDYSRQTGPHKEQADINSVVVAAANLVAQQEIFRNVTLAKKLSSGLPAVKVDVSQMEEVFTNIILNAAEIMDGEGEVEVETSLSADGNRVVVSISDTGAGIPPESLERIFDPFFSSKQSGHGTGLGLAISHGIVENHDGTITARNSAARGATFVVELPVAREEEA